MGKALGLLPSWYWPPGVQRYLKSPRVPLYELAVGRWARRYGNDPALGLDGESRTFRELDEACGAVAGNYLARLSDSSGRVALAVHSAEAFAALFLGLARADATMLLLADPSTDAARSALDDFQPDLLITDGPDLSSAVTVDTRGPAEFLEPGGSTPPRINLDPARPAIALPGGDGLVWHSQMTLLSGAMAFAAFVRLEPPAALMVSRPPAAWEALIGLLGALQAGAPAVIDGGGDPDVAASLLRRHSPAALWLDSSRAPSLLEDRTPLATAIRETAADLFLTTTGVFPGRLRRGLRRRLKTPVLTVFGCAEAGVIAAAHPSWYLDEAVGIPMTGVDIIALNPRTNRPVEPPWELLSYARIGARTYARAVNLESCEEEGSEGIDNRCYNTRTLGVVDANGMLFLLG